MRTLPESTSGAKDVAILPLSSVNLYVLGVLYKTVSVYKVSAETRRTATVFEPL